MTIIFLLLSAAAQNWNSDVAEPIGAPNPEHLSPRETIAKGAL
jgi:hypothetical protein